MTEDDEIAESVASHGWHAIAVGASEASPDFTYTIGLCQTSAHPDVVLFGLPQDVAYPILANLVAKVRAGTSFEVPGSYSGVIRDREVAVRPVHPTQHPIYLGYAMGYYRHIDNSELMRVVQLFWPDPRGRFPYELSCDPLVSHEQPRLEFPAVRGRAPRRE